MFPLSYSDATMEDLPNIVAIYNSTVASRMVTADTEVVSVASKISWFEAHNPNTRPLLVIHNASGDVVGWVSFQSFYGRPAYNGTAELSIYLDEKYRGNGLGKTVLQDMIAAAPKYQLTTILAFIFAHNTPSIRLFRQQGFIEYGNLPDIAVLDGVKRSLIILGKKV